MTDYTKIKLIDIDIEHLFSLPCLEFETIYNEKTYVLSKKHVAKYHHCKITIYDTGSVYFSGSIHKLYNSLNNIKAPNYKTSKTDKGYNGNQFKLVNILEVRTHLTELFNCQPHQMLFKNIEFGVNTEPTFCPNLFTKGLLTHKGNKFEYRHKNNFAQSIKQHFIFKIYNKGNQYKMNTDTLRIELKYLKMAEVKKLGITTFADINKDTLNNAKEQLLKRFDTILYYDYTINKKSLSNKQKQTLIKYSNPRYWIEDLKPNHRDREKKRLKKIINDYSENLHEQLKQEIIKKCTEINTL